MVTMIKGLDAETQKLIGIGAAVAAGCLPCLETMVAAADAEGIDRNKMKTAAIIGQYVKDQPFGQMKALADRLLGTHLQQEADKVQCPSETPAANASTAGCGCSPGDGSPCCSG